MLLERFEEKGLAHYSYAVGCEEKGQVAIIDPRRDVEVYLEYAEKNRLIISHVFETHIHADYASGARELAKRSRASLYLSGYDHGEMYEVSFSHKECLEEDFFRLGCIQLKVLHTPGHSPEHISFLLYDLKKASNIPVALFSGDFLLVGSVGRPDLLGEENTQSLAKKLYHSIQTKLKDLPEELDIFPAHGSGSFCGSGMNQRPFSKLGFEKLSNPFLNPGLSEKDFVSQLLSRDLPIPPYFQKMKEYNSCCKRLEVPMPTPLDLQGFKKQVDLGAVVIDLRGQSAFGGGHVPSAICIGAGVKIGFWAAWCVPYHHPIVLVTDDPTHLEETVHALARVDLDQVQGYLKGGFATWKAAGLPISYIEQVTPEEMVKKAQSDSDFQIVDVRTEAEWNMSHISGAHHVPCFELAEKIKEMPPKKLIFVCAGGYRSTWAASLAKRAGYDLIGHIPGGMHAWQGASLDVTSS